MVMAVGWQVGPGDDEAVVDPCPPQPEDLLDPDEVPPAAVLLAADPASLPGQWVDAGMSTWFARTNQVVLEQARWILETSRARAGAAERTFGRPRAGKIVAASLGWSESWGAQRIEFARQILERLPAVGDAMRDGRLEERKSLIFTTTLADLDDAQAREVVDRVLPEAPRLAFRALQMKVESTAEAVDPAWAEARRAAAVARRRVAFRVAPSGAAELCGLDLPEDPAQDSHDRIVALGRAVARRLRAAGMDAPKGPIESEVMLTLTGPAGAGMWDQDVVDHVVGRFEGPDSEGPDDSGPDDSGPDDRGPDDSRPDEGRDEDGFGADHGSNGDAHHSLDDMAGDEPGAHRSDHAAPTGDDAIVPRTATDGVPGPAEDRRQAIPFVPRVALRIGLRTLMGLDRRPGTLPGRGPVISSIAAAMAWGRAHGSCRLLLYGPGGDLEYALQLRMPAHGPPPIGGRRREQIVEVTAYTAELDALAHALDPAQVLPGLETAGVPMIFRAVPRGAVVVGDALTLLERAARALARARAQAPDDHPARTLADADRRFPGAALRLWVEARDRTCRAAGCSADAATCDIDHTLPVVDGGTTVADDLGAFCRRDHTFKHDAASAWTVRQAGAGHFVWTAPTGRVHHVDPEPYDPLPDPVPRADGAPGSLPAGLFAPHPEPPPPGLPRRNRYGYITDASRATAAYLRQRVRGTTDDTAPLPTDVAVLEEVAGAR